MLVVTAALWQLLFFRGHPLAPPVYNFRWVLLITNPLLAQLQEPHEPCASPSTLGSVVGALGFGVGCSFLGSGCFHLFLRAASRRGGGCGRRGLTLPEGRGVTVGSVSPSPSPGPREG